MNRRRMKLLAILLMFAIGFSLTAFLIPVPKGTVFWISYISEMLAIVLQVPVFKSTFDENEKLKSKVLGFPVFRVGYLYLGIQTILSSILIIVGKLETFPAWLASMLCMLVCVGAIICSITAGIARDIVQQSETSVELKISWMQSMRTLTTNLSSMANDSELKKALLDLADDFRFSDPVSTNTTEKVERELGLQINDLIEKLNKGNTTLDDVQMIRNLLKQRNLLCKAVKK